MGGASPPLPVLGPDLPSHGLWLLGAAVWERRPLHGAGIGCRISAPAQSAERCHRADAVSAYLGEAAAAS